MIQRIALYATLGMVLDAAALTITDLLFWCILALFLASEWMTRRELIEQLNQELQAMRRSQQQDKNND
jgi:hypothetical protein